MNIAELPTPALLLDIDLLESNIAAMAAHVSKTGKKLRPHAKAHKCVQIAKRQIDAGAAGICVATVAEAELMARANIPGLLLTSPIADPRKCARIAALGASVVVDHPDQVRMYEEAAKAAGVTLSVLVDLDLGDHRTGIAPGQPALDLARKIASTATLNFAGLQAYSVRASHMRQDEGRADFSVASLQGASDTKKMIEAAGLAVAMITGGSTATYDCDASVPYVTELQSGTYALMDRAYARVGGVPFGHALSVLATVISANHEDRVTVDAGFKAFATDRPFGPEAADVEGVWYEWAGDEFGFVFLDKPSRKITLGDRLRFIPPHCDPTVNLYSCFCTHRGEVVEEMWPIMDRLPEYRY